MTVNQRTQDFMLYNGRSIVLPPYVDNQSGYGNLTLPDLSVADAAQRYPLGTKYIDGDKVFKYIAAKATLSPNLGAKNGQVQSISYTTIAAATLQYATQVVVDAAATDGRAGDGAIAADELAGGEILIFDATGPSYKMTIKGNTAIAAGGGEVTIDLIDKIPVALIADTDHAEVMASPYSYVNTSNSYPVIGVPVLAYTNGQYGWVQTWGPTWISPQSTVGTDHSKRMCIFRHDGSIDSLIYNDAYASQGQLAGYVMSVVAAFTQAAPFIFLMVSN